MNSKTPTHTGKKTTNTIQNTINTHTQMHTTKAAYKIQPLNPGSKRKQGQESLQSGRAPDALLKKKGVPKGPKYPYGIWDMGLGFRV